MSGPWTCCRCGELMGSAAVDVGLFRDMGEVAHRSCEPSEQVAWAEAELQRMIARVAGLTARAEAAEKRAAALVELAEEMIGYVPQYFVDKHDLRKELDALLAPTVP